MGFFHLTGNPGATRCFSPVQAGTATDQPFERLLVTRDELLKQFPERQSVLAPG
jgi:hypothetical protein